MYLNFNVSVGLHVDVGEGNKSAVNSDQFVITFRLIGRTLVHVETNESPEIVKEITIT